MIGILLIFKHPVHQAHKIKAELDGLLSKTTLGFLLNLVFCKSKVVPKKSKAIPVTGHGGL
jgi:hypothetical protein